MHENRGSGWKAAEYSGSGSYQNLLVGVYNFASNDYGIHSAPLSLVRAGLYYFNNGNPEYKGSYGRYQESVTSGWNVQAYALHFYSSALSPANGYEKGIGHSLRCVIR